jgi:hypothetical protein
LADAPGAPESGARNIVYDKYAEELAAMYGKS